jgi:thioesterase domain-containing protein
MRAEKMGFEAEGLGRAYGWDEIVQGGFELVEVPGDHDTLVLEPNATTLVQRLRSTLDDVQATRMAS